MIVQIAAGGRARAVDVRRTDDGFIAVIDGREHTVDVKEINGSWSFLIGPPPMRSHEVTFVDVPDGAMMVHVDGQAVPVSVIPARAAWGGRAGPSTALGAGAAAQGTAGPQRVVAPMPGKIVKLLVKPGDRVEARQGLVVVEAMKMENELRSRAAGTVSEVRVTEGASVEAGAILVIVE